MLVGGCTDVCSIGGAPRDGVIASSDAVMIEYGAFVAAATTDCPLAVTGTEVHGDGALALCSHDDGASFDVVALSGTAANCTVALVTADAGATKAEGLCDGGLNTNGFALVVDGSASISRTCATGTDAQSIKLRGRVAVHPAD